MPHHRRRVTLSNFVPIGQAIVQLLRFVYLFKTAAIRNVELCCYTRAWTTREEYLVVFVTVQNLFGIGAVVSIICKF